MGYFRLCFLFFALLTSRISGQSNLSNNRIQLNYSLASNFLSNAPVYLALCEEGCIPFSQQPRISNNFYVNYYRNLSKWSEIKLGLGLYNYMIEEHGFASKAIPGLNSIWKPTRYRERRQYRFLNFSVGHRLNLCRQGEPIFYIEKDLIFDHQNTEYHLKSLGLSILISGGGTLLIYDNFKFQAGAFYKTAISKYNIDFFPDNNFLPYSFGLDFRVSMDF